MSEQKDDILPVANIEDFDHVLTDPNRLDVALVDITGFDHTIWQYCAELRARDVPLLLVAPRKSAAIAEAGAEHGTSNVMVKPLVIRELLNLIELLIQS